MVCIGPVTAETARAHGLEVTVGGRRAHDRRPRRGAHRDAATVSRHAGRRGRVRLRRPARRHRVVDLRDGRGHLRRVRHRAAGARAGRRSSAWPTRATGGAGLCTANGWEVDRDEWWRRYQAIDRSFRDRPAGPPGRRPAARRAGCRGGAAWASPPARRGSGSRATSGGSGCSTGSPPWPAWTAPAWASPRRTCTCWPARILDADPARSVAVEDSGHGIAAAKAAGLACVAVPSRITRHTDLSAADLTVDVARRPAPRRSGPAGRRRRRGVTQDDATRRHRPHRLRLRSEDQPRRQHRRLRGEPGRPRGEQVPQRDLAGGRRRLLRPVPVLVRRARRQRPGVVAGRPSPRVHQPPGRGQGREAQGHAPRRTGVDPRRGRHPGRAGRGLRPAGLVARRHPPRLHLPRAGSWRRRTNASARPARSTASSAGSTPSAGPSTGRTASGSCRWTAPRRRGSLTGGPYEATSATWSPDGTRIAFVSARHEDFDLDEENDLFVLEVDAPVGDDGELPEPTRLTSTDRSWSDPVVVARRRSHRRADLRHAGRRALRRRRGGRRGDRRAHRPHGGPRPHLRAVPRRPPADLGRRRPAVHRRGPRRRARVRVPVAGGPPDGGGRRRSRRRRSSTRSTARIACSASTPTRVAEVFVRDARTATSGAISDVGVGVPHRGPRPARPSTSRCRAPTAPATIDAWIVAPPGRRPVRPVDPAPDAAQRPRRTDDAVRPPLVRRVPAVGLGRLRRSCTATRAARPGRPRTGPGPSARRCAKVRPGSGWGGVDYEDVMARARRRARAVPGPRPRPARHPRRLLRRLHDVVGDRPHRPVRGGLLRAGRATTCSPSRRRPTRAASSAS